MQLIYDGSFPGLLSTIFTAYEYKLNDALIVRTNQLQSLTLSESMEVYTETAKAERVWKGLKKKIAAQGLELIYRSYLSELPSVENSILEVVRYALQSDQNILEDYGHSHVLTLHQIARKVGREKHRFEAFVRFENIGNNWFYADIAPDFNILPLIAPHFKERYAAQNWMIYDSKRKYGIQYDSVSEQINELTFRFEHAPAGNLSPIVQTDPDEKLYQELWKRYFKSTNIALRKNTKLHLQHVPKRYWRYLTEKKES
ncbi:MAG: TIGR03915 family putative DNA repair protein [Sediminibacterium sp.]|nr:TIGR03915 family putative DNA repair protein [Sediminibacterium sp.]